MQPDEKLLDAEDIEKSDDSLLSYEEDLDDDDMKEEQ